MTKLDMEVEYNNRLRVPEYGAFNARWAAESEAYRGTAHCELDLPYGTTERQQYDLFHAVGDKPNGVLVYIHGGYWQWGTRKDHSRIARELNKHGVTVAIPSYTLCPAGTVMDIVNEMRTAVKAVYQRLGARVAVAGHSAGGHLTGAMLATDWTALSLPADAVRAAYAISGAFDPEPLVETSIGKGAGLTADMAQQTNVMRWRPPLRGTRFMACVGATESSEFHRQSRDLVHLWSQAWVVAEAVVVPQANHFTAVDELSRSDSAMTVRIAELARWAAA
jgi:arylformamidase